MRVPVNFGRSHPKSQKGGHTKDDTLNGLAISWQWRMAARFELDFGGINQEAPKRGCKVYWNVAQKLERESFMQTRLEGNAIFKQRKSVCRPALWSSLFAKCAHP